MHGLSSSLVGLALAAALSGVAAPAAAKDIRLTLREGTNFSAGHSPADGSFVLDLQGTLWRLSAEGGRATALTDGLGDDRLPDVSRDGAAIVFQSYRNGTWDVFRSEDTSLSANIRFRWEYRPGSDLFVVYSEGRDTFPPGTPLLESRSFVVKFTRLFRF